MRKPGTSRAFALVAKTLPFGASASVYHFNRFARFLQSALVYMRVLAPNYYDDFPCICPGMTGSQRKAFELLLHRSLASSPVLILTDGSCEPKGQRFFLGIGGVLVDKAAATKVRMFGGQDPETVSSQWLKRFKHVTHVIGLVELYALVLSLQCWGILLQGRRVICFLDEDSVLCACIKRQFEGQTLESLACAHGAIRVGSGAPLLVFKGSFCFEPC